MPQLNHTIVWCKDKAESAAFLTGILGLPPACPFLGFLVVDLGNGVSMDYYEQDQAISRQHYAFLVSEAEFDAGLANIKAQGAPYWADPARSQPGAINQHWGGRGIYFEDPNGHLLELITKPYGKEEDL